MVASNLHQNIAPQKGVYVGSHPVTNRRMHLGEHAECSRKFNFGKPCRNVPATRSQVWWKRNKQVPPLPTRMIGQMRIGNQAPGCCPSTRTQPANSPVASMRLPINLMQPFTSLGLTGLSEKSGAGAEFDAASVNQPSCNRVETGVDDDRIWSFAIGRRRPAGRPACGHAPRLRSCSTARGRIPSLR